MLCYTIISINSRNLYVLHINDNHPLMHFKLRRKYFNLAYTQSRTRALDLDGRSVSKVDDRSRVTVTRIARFLVHPVPERHNSRILRSYARRTVRDKFFLISEMLIPGKNENNRTKRIAGVTLGACTKSRVRRRYI